MRILIATGIYPPDIGGPAQYARNLYETWKKQGHEVAVAAYRWERAFPKITRHFLYFLKVIRKGWKADMVLVLDTWSAAVPTMFACRLMRKGYLIRTGGDFLWEAFVERTGDKILFGHFYKPENIKRFTKKEKLIFKWGGQALRSARTIIFSTEWQRDIFERAYGLDPKKNRIVRNYCGKREPPIEPTGRVFAAGARSLRWKNIEFLKEAFADARLEAARRGLPDVELDTGKAVYENFVEKIRRAYCVVLVSLGDISPNVIFDAIRVGTPFIMTKENGIAELVKEGALFVDPLDKKDIIEKIAWIADPQNRAIMVERLEKITFSHSWKEIADEIIKVWKAYK